MSLPEAVAIIEGDLAGPTQLAEAWRTIIRAGQPLFVLIDTGLCNISATIPDLRQSSEVHS